MRPYYSLSGHWGLTQLTTGQPFYVDKRSRDVTPWIVMAGHWETFVDDVLWALARPGDTFVDAGSNQGYYTVKVGGRLGPHGRVFAFEANPEMFAFTQENISINGMAQRDVAVNAALGAEPGVLRFCHEPSRPGGGVILLPGEEPPADREVRSVPVVTLDSALPPGTRIDLMKIDVEGFEVPALRGMTETLARSPDAAVVCEVDVVLWSRFGDPGHLLTALAGGRRLFRIYHDGHLEEMDGERLADWLEPDFVSYVLMLPDTPERLAQLEPIFARFAAQPASTPPDPAPAPERTAETAPVGAATKELSPPASSSARTPLWRRATGRILRS